MKELTCGTKRVMGTALAALTVIAGMSAVAFAGEPVKGELGKADPMKAIGMEKAMKVELDLKGMQGKIVENGEDGSMICVLEDGQTVEITMAQATDLVVDESDAMAELNEPATENRRDAIPDTAIPAARLVEAKQ